MCLHKKVGLRTRVLKLTSQIPLSAMASFQKDWSLTNNLHRVPFSMGSVEPLLGLHLNWVWNMVEGCTWGRFAKCWGHVPSEAHLRQRVWQKNVTMHAAMTSHERGSGPKWPHLAPNAVPVSLRWDFPGHQKYYRNCLKQVQFNSVPSRLLPNSCLLNPGCGPKSSRTSRLFPGSF